MATNSISLVVPASGAGVAVDSSDLGKAKTIVFSGSVNGVVKVQIAPVAGARFCTVAVFTAPGKQVIEALGEEMRVVVSGSGGSGSVDIAAVQARVSGIELAVPVGPGVGASLPVASIASEEYTIVVTSGDGIIQIEISNDNSDWASLDSFVPAGGCRTYDVGAAFARVRRSGGAAATRVFIAGTTASGQSVIATNLAPGEPPPAGNQTIFVRTTGSDETGDGSAAFPYRTLKFAVSVTPHIVPTDVNIFFDITGIDEDVGGNGVDFSDWIARSALTQGAWPVEPRLRDYSSVNVFAQPTLIFSAVPTSISTDPITGLVSAFFASAPFTPSAHVGQFARSTSGNDNQNGTIYANTADTLFICAATFSGVDALEILDTGAILRTTADRTVIRNSGLSSVSFGGVEIIGSQTVFFSVISYASYQGSVFSKCRFNALYHQQNGRFIRYVDCHRTGPAGKGDTFNAHTVWFLRNSLWEAEFYEYRAACAIDANVCYMAQGMPGFGLSRYREILLDRVIIDNATGVGLELTADGLAEIERTIIQNSGGDGILAQNGTVVLKNVDDGAGGNTGIFLNIGNGAQVQADAATEGNAPTGTGGDLQVGGNAPNTWAGYIAGPPASDENDLGASPSQICRLFK